MIADTLGVVVLSIGLLGVISACFAYVWRELNDLWPDDDAHLGELDPD